MLDVPEAAAQSARAEPAPRAGSVRSRGPKPALAVGLRFRRVHDGHGSENTGLTDLVFTKKGNVALLRLHALLQVLIRWGFEYIEGFVVAIDSFPDVPSNKKVVFLADVLRRSATQNKSPEELVYALDHDEQFITNVSALVSRWCLRNYSMLILG